MLTERRHVGGKHDFSGPHSEIGTQRDNHGSDGSARNKSMPRENNNIKFREWLTESMKKKMRVKSKKKRGSQRDDQSECKSMPELANIARQRAKDQQKKLGPFDTQSGNTISALESSNNALPSRMFSSGMVHEEFKAKDKNMNILSSLGEIVENAGRFVEAHVDPHTKKSKKKTHKNLDSVGSTDSVKNDRFMYEKPKSPMTHRIKSGIFSSQEADFAHYDKPVNTKYNHSVDQRGQSFVTMQVSN